MSSPSPGELRQLTVKFFLTYQLNSLPALLPLIYMMGLVTGLDAYQSLTTAIYVLPVVVPTLTLVGPFVLIHGVLRDAFSRPPGDTPERRLERLLKVPRRIELRMVALAVLGTLIYAAFPAFYYGKSFWIVPWTAALTVLQFMMLWINIRLSLERLIAPHATAQFKQLRTHELRGQGLYWTRQKWYLPYAFGLYVVCTLSMMVSVVAKLSVSTFDDFFVQLHTHPGVDLEPLLHQTLEHLAQQLLLPLVLLGSYVLITAAVCAWRLATYQSDGARAVQKAIEGLATGAPQMPEWVSTDEVGDLSLATAKMLVHLQRFSLSLRGSAQSLQDSARELSSSAGQQGQMLTQQASALQETQVTTQEIKQTSEVAAQRAEGVLAQTQYAERISKAAEASIQKSMGSLEAIRADAGEMMQHINALGGKARQIAQITETVKGLADRSHMLALNAAIESVRSGEHGKGFGVVAREIRALADQSIKATSNVGQILDDIATAIRVAVTMAERGSSRANEGLAQVREFGESIRQLSGIVSENGNSVRQISAAVAQQNVGIVEIFKAVGQLSAMMNQTVERLKQSDEAVDEVNGVVAHVSEFVGAYGWEQMGPTQPPPLPSQR